MKSHKELEFQEFKNLLLSTVEYGKDPIDCKYEIECGRGSYLYVMRLFTEEMDKVKPINLLDNKTIGLSIGYVIKNIFIPGLGMLEITHNPKFDKSENRSMDIQIIGSLPITCYNFELFKFKDNNKLSIIKSSVLVELPKPTLFQRFKNWLKLKLN